MIPLPVPFVTLMLLRSPGYFCVGSWAVQGGWQTPNGHQGPLCALLCPTPEPCGSASHSLETMAHEDTNDAQGHRAGHRFRGDEPRTRLSSPEAGVSTGQGAAQGVPPTESFRGTGGGVVCVQLLPP